MQTLSKKLLMIACFAPLAVGCAMDQGAEHEPAAAVLPIAVYDVEGTALVAGSYDVAEGKIYLVDSLLTSMDAAMAELGDNASFAVADSGWSAELTTSYGILEGVPTLGAGDLFRIVGANDQETLLQWDFKIHQASWVDGLTEEEAASRYPECDVPDCGGCTILDPVVVTPE
ncbi:MAG: hypothetical protein Tsb0020_09250 [Haliangiales bacterium]